jgi:hypothetical protein
LRGIQVLRLRIPASAPHEPGAWPAVNAIVGSGAVEQGRSLATSLLLGQRPAARTANGPPLSLAWRLDQRAAAARARRPARFEHAINSPGPRFAQHTCTSVHCRRLRPPPGLRWAAIVVPYPRLHEPPELLQLNVGLAGRAQSGDAGRRERDARSAVEASTLIGRQGAAVKHRSSPVVFPIAGTRGPLRGTRGVPTVFPLYVVEGNSGNTSPRGVPERVGTRGNTSP